MLPGRESHKLPNPHMVATAPKRFWNKVNKTDTCWLWTAMATKEGYGLLALSRDGCKVLAHRFSYELNHGPIPDGLVIDHTCRTPRCVNPAHLEAVTPRENVMRGVSPVARQVDQTHCKRGHPFDAANTRIDKKGARRCRTCHRDGERTRQRAGRAFLEQMGEL